MQSFIDNRYRLLRQLGAGGMGVVWEAEHTGVGRRVAVKLLHKSLLEKESSLLGRLQREARLAGSLDSPHIAAVLDTGIDQASGSPYLVMEYLVGEDLQTLITRAEKLPHPLALRIAAQACLGLKKAHDAKIIHRDVKPANMFLARRDGEVTLKVLDFGIAKLRPDDLSTLDNANLTRTGSLIGSPLFMSPEQARGMKTVDQRADVWSLGVVLFNMLTGRTPYDSIDALGELILAICSTASPSVRDYAPDVPMEVAEIVQRALQISPDARFQTAGEMHTAIMGVLDGTKTIPETMLEGFPEPPPGSRRFLPGTPAGPQGTAVLPSLDPGSVGDSGEVRRNSHAPSALSATETSISDVLPPGASGGTPVPELDPRTSPSPGARGPAGTLPVPPTAVTSTDTNSSTTTAPVKQASTGKSKAAWAGVALALGIGAAWMLFARGSGETTSGPPAVGTAAATTGGDPTSKPTVTITSIPEPSIAPPPEASSPIADVASSASASPLGSGKSPVGGPTGTGRPVPSAKTTAKPVDTTGFGDRK